MLLLLSQAGALQSEIVRRLVRPSVVIFYDMLTLHKDLILLDFPCSCLISSEPHLTVLRLNIVVPSSRLAWPDGCKIKDKSRVSSQFKSLHYASSSNSLTVNCFLIILALFNLIV